MTTGETTAAQAAAGQTVIEERKAPPAAVVIFGASGDLTARKLGPAVENLARHKRIPAEFGVVGVARTQLAPADFRSRMAGAEGSVMPALYEGFRYVAGGYDDPDAHRRLRETLEALDTERGTSGNRLFYLATPPEAFGPAPSCSPPCSYWPPRSWRGAGSAHTRSEPPQPQTHLLLTTTATRRF